MARLSCASVVPETTPRVPPPSLIFRVARARPDRLGVEVRPQVVAGVDDDDRHGRRRGGRRREREKRGNQGERETHVLSVPGGGRGRTLGRRTARRIS